MSAVAMNEETRRMEQYNDIVANITPTMIDGKGKNQRVITGNVTVPLSCCYVDKRYQGMRMHKHLDKLINKWDLRKLGPITIVPHPEEYRFAIVDGQGRFLVAPMKGLDRLNATVLMDAPEDEEERLKFEAERFIGQDEETEEVKQVEKHLARVLLKEEAAMIIERLLKKYDVKFLATKGSRKESVLGSYPNTYGIALTHGGKCLDFAFSIIENAGWHKEKNGYSTFVMNSLKEVWVAHPMERDRMHCYLSENLRQIDPEKFGANAISKYPKREKRAACILYMEDIVCDGLCIEKRIYKLNKSEK